MNLPLAGAVANGLFADHGLDVELAAPSAPGGADFAMTAVHSRLTARARHPDRMQPRFVAVVHQRSPLAAFVRQESPLRWPSDLAGARVAASTAPWFDLEYRAGLEALGLEPGVVVPPREGGVRPSLVDGEVEVIGSWDEAVAVIRRRAGVAGRSIPFGPQVYTTGVVAADHVPADVVARMVAALRDAFEEQRSDPRRGLDELCRRYPGVDPAGALEEWAVLEDYVFATGQPLAMSARQWEATMAHAARTYGTAPVPVAEICREELAGSASVSGAGA